MEGPLCKWTNVVQGWQYRWFVLDLAIGVLSYYTSKDKMVRGDRRGCVKLKNAQVGINDEDDSTFTITVDSKVFHFQAQNAEERQKWLDALQEARDLHTENYALLQQTSRLLDQTTTVSEFDRQIIEADAYLQILIDQHQQLDAQFSSLDSLPTLSCEALKSRLQRLIELVKKTIVCLQFAKENTAISMVNLLDPPPQNDMSSMSDESAGPPPSCESRASGGTDPIVPPPPDPLSASAGAITNERTATGGALSSIAASQREQSVVSSKPSGVHLAVSPTASRTLTDIKSGARDVVGKLISEALAVTTPKPIVTAAASAIPEVSYSSSEEESEEFYDTHENPHTLSPTTSLREEDFTTISVCSSGLIEGELERLTALDSSETLYSVPIQPTDESLPPGSFGNAVPAVAVGWQSSNVVPRKYAKIFASDELYDEDDEKDLGSVQSQGSVITYLISQLRIGMDLTRITLPTFILEKRSTLEMYADFLAHPDLWIAIADGATPCDRMLACLRWYLSAFHASRRSDVAKKPYNPILGEVFRCCWPMQQRSQSTDSGVALDPEDVPVIYPDEELARSGPLPFAADDCVVFLAEQVSHHPPISAFYAEYPPSRIQVGGHIWTKSKFLGLSIGVEMVGNATVSLLDLDEDYTVTFPSAYGRNILSIPWVELGGRCTIDCPRTGFSATVDFRTKPFYGGKKDQIRAEVFAPGEKRPMLTVDGEWNGKMWARWAEGKSELFIDTKAMPIMMKRLRPREIQAVNESRKLWEEVTHNLKVGNIDAATDAKTRLEQRQRREAAARQEANEKWDPHFFSEQGNSYIYRWPLASRIYQAPSNNITQSNNLADPLANPSALNALHSDNEPPTPTPPTSSSAFDDLQISGPTARSEDGGLEIGQAVLELSTTDNTESEVD
ncbi:hypothetical protein AAHC03_016687 [Spirometra sp. Aus1]